MFLLKVNYFYWSRFLVYKSYKSSIFYICINAWINLIQGTIIFVFEPYSWLKIVSVCSINLKIIQQNNVVSYTIKTLTFQSKVWDDLYPKSWFFLTKYIMLRYQFFRRSKMLHTWTLNCYKERKQYFYFISMRMNFHF